MTDKPLSLKSARTLTINYNLPVSKTAKFWEELKNGKIYATKCKMCGKLHFPPVVDCGCCGSSDVEWTELTGKGEIVTFTEVLVKPASFSEHPSYVVAVAALDEGVKVLAWLTGVTRENVFVGMNVKLVPKVFSKDRISYEFIPL